MEELQKPEARSYAEIHVGGRRRFKFLQGLVENKDEDCKLLGLEPRNRRSSMGRKRDVVRVG